jgi:hypothetical protein
MARALPALRRLALRFTLVAGVLLVIAGAFAATIIEPLVPVLDDVVAAVSRDFTFLGTELDHGSGQPKIVFRANLSRVQLVGNRFVYPLGFGSQPQGWYQVTLTTGGVLQHALLLLIIVLAWPATARELLLRCLLAVPLAALLLWQHVAVTVLAELWFVVREEPAPGEFWPLLAWSRFLMGGGGLAIALALAILAIVLAQRLARRPARTAAT